MQHREAGLEFYCIEDLLHNNLHTNYSEKTDTTGKGKQMPVHYGSNKLSFFIVPATVGISVRKLASELKN
nr:hypothetical protein [Tanacetum cinerariifolium]